VIDPHRALPDPLVNRATGSKLIYGPYPGNRIMFGLSAFFAAPSTPNARGLGFRLSRFLGGGILSALDEIAWRGP